MTFFRDGRNILSCDICREKKILKCEGDRRKTKEMGSRDVRTKNRAAKRRSLILFSPRLYDVIVPWILHIFLFSQNSDTATIQESNWGSMLMCGRAGWHYRIIPVWLQRAVWRQHLCQSSWSLWRRKVNVVELIARFLIFAFHTDAVHTWTIRLKYTHTH